MDKALVDLKVFEELALARAQKANDVAEGLRKEV